MAFQPKLHILKIQSFCSVRFHNLARLLGHRRRLCNTLSLNQVPILAKFILFPSLHCLSTSFSVYLCFFLLLCLSDCLCIAGGLFDVVRDHGQELVTFSNGCLDHIGLCDLAHDLYLNFLLVLYKRHCLRPIFMIARLNGKQKPCQWDVTGCR